MVEALAPGFFLHDSVPLDGETGKLGDLFGGSTQLQVERARAS